MYTRYENVRSDEALSRETKLRVHLGFVSSLVASGAIRA